MTKYYSDGFIFGRNPSLIGGGYTIVDERNRVIKREVIYKVGMTANEAELLGVLEATRIAKKGDVISTDSMVTLTWVNSGSSKARPDLKEVIEEAHKNLYPNGLQKKGINRGRPLRDGAFLIWEPREINLAGILNENDHPEPELEKMMMNNPVIDKGKAEKMKEYLKKENETLLKRAIEWFENLI